MSDSKYSRINYSMELFKIIAAFAVVFSHVRFPGRTGAIVNSICRFAVPFFFALSGYFSFNADEIRIKKRLFHILKIMLIASLFYALWGCFTTKWVSHGSRLQYLKGRLDLHHIALWLFMEMNPFAPHLWYLSSMAVTYLLYYIYTAFWKEKEISYSYLYLFAGAALLFQLVFGLKAPGVSLDVDYKIYRNSLFFGLPVFSMGLFIREYKDRLLYVFNLTSKKAFLLILIGTALSPVQWLGIGQAEVPVGSFLDVFIILLLLAEHPDPFPNNNLRKCILLLGNASLIVYIIHPFFHDLFKLLAKKEGFAAFIVSHGYVYPFFIAVISSATGILYSLILGMLKKN